MKRVLSSLKKILKGAAVFPFFVFFLGNSGIFQAEYSFSEARKVFAAIDRIQAAERLPENGQPRNITIKQSEFNSYIAYRIEHEHSKILKQLEFKFFEKNKLEGHALIHFRGQDISGALNPVMDIYFEAFLEVDAGRSRLNMKKIFINGQFVQPALLDLILVIASKVEPLEISSMSDWYKLPYGIRNIQVHRGYAAFFY